MKNRAFLAVLIFLVIFYSGVLISATYHQGADFEVYWRAGKSLLEDTPLYDPSRAGGMVLKYPPWIASGFILISLFSLPIAKCLWGLIQVLSLGSLVLQLKRSSIKQPWWVFILLVFSYWGLWIVHFLDGQVTLVATAIAMRLFEPRLFTESLDFSPMNRKRAFTSAIRFSFLVAVLSVKVLTILPVGVLFFSVGLSQGASQFKRDAKKWLFYGISSGVLLAVLSIPAWRSHGYLSLDQFFEVWLKTSQSGGQLLAPAQVRGRLNPSVPSLILQALSIPASLQIYDKWLSVVSAVVASAVWLRVSLRLSIENRFIGALAIVPMIHPLPFWHTYVMTFPLFGVLVLHALSSEFVRLRKWLFFSWFLMIPATEKVFGRAGLFIETLGPKVWATFIFLILAAIYLRKDDESGRIAPL